MKRGRCIGMNDYQFLFEGEFLDPDGNEETHDVFDAGLRGGATLHRFNNSSSAIYVGNEERAICFRDAEAEMIAAWNAGKEWQGVDVE